MAKFKEKLDAIQAVVVYSGNTGAGKNGVIRFLSYIMTQ